MPLINWPISTLTLGSVYWHRTVPGPRSVKCDSTGRPLSMSKIRTETFWARSRVFERMSKWAGWPTTARFKPAPINSVMLKKGLNIHDILDDNLKMHDNFFYFLRQVIFFELT
jgi:hypothetical protein